MMHEFSFATTPNLRFGSGKINTLPKLIDRFGTKVLLVTGASSFTNSRQGQTLLDVLKRAPYHIEIVRVEQEPSPETIDAAVGRYIAFMPDVVVAVGGGSAMDAGKAISAMLPLRHSIRDYLEGVGTRSHPGTKVPFIAVPTTAGTGSEATKNAVISEVGPNGFKRSLRHDSFVPDVAIVDPELLTGCPPSTTATSGMDAFTQLLESYLSTSAHPMTDAWAMTGLRMVRDSLMASYEYGSDVSARAGMALAAYLSGVTLANAGLGLVHGFASSIGARYSIAHGSICSALMSPVNTITVKKLRRENSNPSALKKYSDVGKLFARSDDRDEGYYTDFLLDTIAAFTSKLDIPMLREGGITSGAAGQLAAETDNKNHPIRMSTDEMEQMILLAR